MEDTFIKVLQMLGIMSDLFENFYSACLRESTRIYVIILCIYNVLKVRERNSLIFSFI